MMRIMSLTVGMVRTNCYIPFDDETKRCFIVDPGDEADRIVGAIKDKSLTPEAIILTHGHFDHITGVPGVLEAYPDIPVYAYKAEAALLGDANVNESAMTMRPVTLSGVRYLEDGEELSLIGEKWKLISTPGHTIGSCCYYDEAAGVLFSGDTLFCGDCGRTDLATGSWESIVHSIREVLMKLPDDVRVLPGHEEITTIGAERIYNTVMRMR